MHRHKKDTAGHSFIQTRELPGNDSFHTMHVHSSWGWGGLVSGGVGCGCAPTPGSWNWLLLTPEKVFAPADRLPVPTLLKQLWVALVLSRQRKSHDLRCLGVSWRWLFCFSSKEEENNIWIYCRAARAISGIARPRYKVQQMARAAGRAKWCTPEPLREALAPVATAKLENMLTAFHEDKLSGRSSDGAIKIRV